MREKTRRTHGWRSVKPLLLVLSVSMPAANVAAQRAPDTTVVRVGGPRYAGVAALEKELSIGTLDGAAEYAFGRPIEALTLRDGSVLVLDAQIGTSPVLRQYDKSGRYVRTFGRAGQGPGEYRGPSGLAQLSDGRVLLLDALNARINVYTESGDPADEWSITGVGLGFGSGGNLRVGPGDVVYVKARERRTGSGTGRSGTIYVRYAPDGTAIDRLADPELPDLGASITRSTPSSATTVGIPYAPQALSALSPLGGFVMGVTARYAFELRMPRAAAASGGAPVWSPADGVVSVRRDSQPVEVGRAERTARREDLEARLERAQGSLSRAIPDIPSTKPPYRRIDVADDGRIWITLSTPSERYDPLADGGPGGGITFGVGGGSGRGAVTMTRSPIVPVPWREPTLYDVFEPDGAYIGQVTVPYDTRILSMRGDAVWAVVTGELDVPVVTRFRIGWR